MKNKIKKLKILAIILTILIAMIYTVAIIFYIKYLKENNYPISGIVLGVFTFIILCFIYPNPKNNDYETFEKKEVNTWEKLTLKRVVKFLVKYHTNLILNLIDLILDISLYID